MCDETRYSADHVWEYILDDYYQFAEPLGKLLAKALSYLPKEDTDSVVEKTFFVLQRNRSEFFPPSFTRSRGIVLICSDDLEGDESKAIVTILHEAGHAFLGHGKEIQFNSNVYEQEEDECWGQVRKWLPNNFHSLINEQEKEGGGTRGLGYLDTE